MSKGYRLNISNFDEKLWISLDNFKDFAQKKLVEQYNDNCIKMRDDNKLLDIMDKLFKQVFFLQKEGKKEAIRYIHFFFLGSSIITDSNEIQINLFSKESYMDKQDAMAIWHPNFILDYHLNSVEVIDKMARQHVKGYSHKQYMDIKLWSYAMYNLQIFSYLLRTAPAIAQLDSFRKMEKESDIQMAFGGYMDKAALIWPMEE